jgi:NitT/TauT family transport system substrate-binding protein
MLFATGSAGNAEDRSITFGVTAAQDYLAGYIADAKGLFKKNGINVEVKFMPNGAAIPPALLSNSVQVGAIPMPVIVQAAAAGFPMRIVSPAVVVPEDAPVASAVGRTGQNIKVAKDFEGKKVGITALNSFFPLLFNQWMRDRGADPKKVTFVEVRGPQQHDVLKSGQVDAVIAPQAFVWGLTSNGTGYLIAPYSGQFKNPSLGGGFVVTKDWADGNPNEVKAFRAAINDAVDFIQKNPRESKEILATYLKLPKEVADSINIGGYSTEIDLAKIEAWNEILLTEKLIDGPIDPKVIVLP